MQRLLFVNDKTAEQIFIFYWSASKENVTVRGLTISRKMPNYLSASYILFVFFTFSSSHVNLTKILFIAAYLFHFSFTFPRTKKLNCSSGNVTEWQKTYEILFTSSKSSRGWFICNIMFQSKMVVLYLLTAPSTDVSVSNSR